MVNHAICDKVGPHETLGTKIICLLFFLGPLLIAWELINTGGNWEICLKVIYFFLCARFGFLFVEEIAISKTKPHAQKLRPFSIYKVELLLWYESPFHHIWQKRDVSRTRNAQSGGKMQRKKVRIFF